MSWMPDLRRFSNVAIGLIGRAPSFGAAPTLSEAIHHLVAKAFKERDPEYLAHLCDQAGAAKCRNEGMESLMEGFQSDQAMGVFAKALEGVESFSGLDIMCGAYRKSLRARAREARSEASSSRPLSRELAAEALAGIGGEVEEMTLALCNAWIRVGDAAKESGPLAFQEDMARRLAVSEATWLIAVALAKGDKGAGAGVDGDDSLLARHMVGLQKVPEDSWDRIWAQRVELAPDMSDANPEFEAWLDAREISKAAQVADTVPGRRAKSL